jgi:signal transduction histidine kinase
VTTWRRHRLDAGLVLLAVAIGSSALRGHPSGPARASVATSVVAVLVFLARRWQPLTVSLLAFASLALGVSFGVDITPLQFFGILATFGLAGALNRPRDAVLVWGAGELTLAYAISHEAAGARLADLALTSAFCTTIWAAGLAVAERGRHAAGAEHRARSAELTRATHAEQARRRERARIAAELHDIVSHGLSVVIVQTVAARQSLDDERAAGRGTAGDADRRMAAVEETAREALADMRRMLGLIQSLPTPDEASPGGDDVDPNPGLRHLGALLQRAADAGLTVAGSGLDDLPPLTPALELAVYRVVQESLTNVIKHAPGARVHVTASQAAGQLTIDVTNEPSAPGRRSRVRPDDGPDRGGDGQGHGLIGLRQRVEVFGGRCAAGPLPDGGFRVEATIPVDGSDTTSHLGPVEPALTEQPDVPSTRSAVGADRP